MEGYEVYLPALQSSGPSLSDWFALISGFGGALLGATIGAVISWMTMRYSSKETARRDRDARRAAQRADALRMVVNVQMIHADVTSARRGIQECFDDAAEAGMNEENSDLWQRVPPLAIEPHKVSANASEIAPFIEAGTSEIANDYLALLANHRSDFHALHVYGVLRRELTDVLPLLEEADGRVLSTSISQEVDRKLRPTMITVENLIQQIVPDLESHAQLAEKLAAAIGPIMRKHLDDNTFPIMKLNGKPMSEEAAQPVTG